MLINTEIGSENRVLEELKKVEGVKEAHNLWGVCDIIASIKAGTIDKLTFIITKKLADIGKVNAKITMISTETQVTGAHPTAIFLEPSTVQNG